jgi:hypothetical protein
MRKLIIFLKINTGVSKFKRVHAVSCGTCTERLYAVSCGTCTERLFMARIDVRQFTPQKCLRRLAWFASSAWTEKPFVTNALSYAAASRPSTSGGLRPALTRPQGQTAHRQYACWRMPSSTRNDEGPTTPSPKTPPYAATPRPRRHQKRCLWGGIRRSLPRGSTRRLSC